MAILTGISNASKGSVTTVNLDVEELFSISSIESDPYFSDPLNVAKAKFIYQSTPGNQKLVLEFDLSQEAPSAKLRPSSTARDEFLLTDIFLYDLDGGSFEVPQGDLPTDLGINFAQKSLKIYYNGSLVTTAQISADINNTQLPLYIGSENSESQTFYAGGLIGFRWTKGMQGILLISPLQPNCQSKGLNCCLM